jgi:AbrB family looped-hinge helix DNA binding protein
VKSATITSKGQITIPKSVRLSLGLEPGDRIEFLVNENGEALVRPVTRKVDEVFGKLSKPGQKPVSVEEMDGAIRQRVKERKVR